MLWSRKYSEAFGGILLNLTGIYVEGRCRLSTGNLFSPCAALRKILFEHHEDLKKALGPMALDGRYLQPMKNAKNQETLRSGPRCPAQVLITVGYVAKSRQGLPYLTAPARKVFAGVQMPPEASSLLHASACPQAAGFSKNAFFGPSPPIPPSPHLGQRINFAALPSSCLGQRISERTCRCALY